MKFCMSTYMINSAFIGCDGGCAVFSSNKGRIIGIRKLENTAAAGTGEAKEAPPTLSAVRAIDGFALRAAAEFRKSNGDFFFSPYSILSVLGMAYESSAGVTRETMAKALSLNDGFHTSLGALSAGLRKRMNG